jgi:hypothetical protein
MNMLNRTTSGTNPKPITRSLKTKSCAIKVGANFSLAQGQPSKKGGDHAVVFLIFVTLSLPRAALENALTCAKASSGSSRRSEGSGG